MGDHQIKSRSGYEWLMQAAKRKINEKYGNLEKNISLIMNVGDQVDVGTLDHYEHIHLFKSELMSPYLPIMTTIGNHETYQDPDMKNYCTHYDYADIEYRRITSVTGAGTTKSTVWGYTESVSGEMTFKLTQADEYYAVLFADGGYTEISPRITFTIEDNGSVNIEQNKEEALKVHYVHSTQSLQIDNRNMEYQKIEIFSSTGMMVQNHFLKPEVNTIDINYQPDEMYLLRFKNDSTYAIKKIIKQ